MGNPESTGPVSTDHIIEAYSAQTLSKILSRVRKYYDALQSPSISIEDEKLMQFEPHELAFIDKYSKVLSNDISVKTPPGPQECTLGHGDKQLKVNLGVLQKMKEKHYIKEEQSLFKSYSPPSSELPPIPPAPEERQVQINNTVNKNVYEIRLDILKEALNIAEHDVDKAMKIAERLYSFVAPTNRQDRPGRRVL